MYNLRYHIASLVAVFLALADRPAARHDRGGARRAGPAADDAREEPADRLQRAEEGERRAAPRPRPGARVRRPTRCPALDRRGSCAGKTVARHHERRSQRRSRDDPRRAASRGGGHGRRRRSRRRTSAWPTASVRARLVLDRHARARRRRRERPRRRGARSRVDAAADEPQAADRRAARRGTAQRRGRRAPAIVADAVVLLASFDGQADPALVALAAAMQKAGRAGGRRRVAGRRHRCGRRLRSAAGISSVDDVDRPEGAVSLVYVLAGKAEGHFGVKAARDERRTRSCASSTLAPLAAARAARERRARTGVPRCANPATSRPVARCVIARGDLDARAARRAARAR